MCACVCKCECVCACVQCVRVSPNVSLPQCRSKEVREQLSKVSFYFSHGIQESNALNCSPICLALHGCLFDWLFRQALLCGPDWPGAYWAQLQTCSNPPAFESFESCVRNTGLRHYSAILSDTSSKVSCKHNISKTQVIPNVQLAKHVLCFVILKITLIANYCVRPLWWFERKMSPLTQWAWHY